jgi:hypothetical protein
VARRIRTGKDLHQHLVVPDRHVFISRIHIDYSCSVSFLALDRIFNSASLKNNKYVHVARSITVVEVGVH